MKQREHGFVLVTTLLMLSVLLALISAYYTAVSIESSLSKGSKDSTTGFYAAEAGLNVRAEAVRQTFVGYNVPEGTSPVRLDACTDGNMGSDDFQCVDYEMSSHTAATYILDNPDNPMEITIPSGERYQNLSALEYRYTTVSEAKNRIGHTEALLELRFKSRLVPLFQFAVFYDKDLEIAPGAAMTLTGPVHTNGHLFLHADNATLDMFGQITTAKDLFRGRKRENDCEGKVKVEDRNKVLQGLAYDCSGPRIGPYAMEDLAAWDGKIEVNVPAVTVPAPEDFDPVPEGYYWARSDLRLVLELDSSTNAPTATVLAPNGAVSVRSTADTDISSLSDIINDKTLCRGMLYETSSGANDGWVASAKKIYDFREKANTWLLDVDMRGLLACLDNYPQLIEGKALNETTHGGLVFFLTVKGPAAANKPSHYAFRVRNAATLRASSEAAGAPTPKGITLISDQPAFVYGNYNAGPDHISKNTAGWLPAAIMADAVNIISSNWQDTYTSATALGSRIAAAIQINSAFLAGTDSTGNAEGEAGFDVGNYNGGLENYPRFHEQWRNASGKVEVLYRGSFVSLNTPRHGGGNWGAQSYEPPKRTWSYDKNFNDARYLPPITPRFVYLRQELFVRDYDKEAPAT